MDGLLQLFWVVLGVMLGLILLAGMLGNTSIGQHMLPKHVLRAIRKVAPGRTIIDAQGDPEGIQVAVRGDLATVRVVRRGAMTFAHASAPDYTFPATGTYFLDRFTFQAPDGIAVPEDLIFSCLQASLEANLTPKGIAPTEGGTADFSIKVFGAFEDVTDVSQVNDRLGHEHSAPWSNPVTAPLAGEESAGPHLISAGSLVLDMIDVATRKLVWRAAATAEIDVDVPQDERRARLERAVAGMLEQFPPRLASAG